MSIHGRISRRTLLKGIALFSAAAVPLLASATAAEAKATKSAVHYQDFPNGMRTCSMCKFFISAGGRRSGMMGHRMMGAAACQLVEGRISPMGYCDLYAPRSA